MPSKNIGAGISDYFGWLIMNFFGIGMMWFVVMAALKSSEFTSKIAGSLQTIASSAIMNAPFIPIPGGKTSLGALQTAPSTIENTLRSGE